MAIVKTDDRHYAGIADAIRAKNGEATRYTPQQMPEAIRSLKSGSTIRVTAPSGADVTCALGEVQKQGTLENGVWVFENCDEGLWTVTAEQGSQSKVRTVKISQQDRKLCYGVDLFFANVYGICRDITDPSPLWTRTQDAVGLRAKASAGAAAGYSDFDNCYPWSGMIRETLGTGDVMVKIPKFWFRRYRKGDHEHIEIAGQALPGFQLHPAFCHGGIARDHHYVAAYKTSANNKSESGAAPRVKQTRAACRTQAMGKGAGWYQMDVSTVSAIQLLYLVEFANNNVQDAVGAGYTAGTLGSNAAMNTGTTDSVPNLTGSADGAVGWVDVVWRGIEGMWSNVYEYMDGINVDAANRGYYVCNDPALYADDTLENYTALSYSADDNVSASTAAFVTGVGLDESLQHVMLPCAIGNGSSTTYFCDTTLMASKGITIVKFGGRWYGGDACGLFNADASNTAANNYIHGGSRMIYIPQVAAT